MGGHRKCPPPGPRSQRFWAEESVKASEEAKSLTKKQTAITEKVADNRKHRKVDSAGPSATQSPNPSNTESEEDLRKQIQKLRDDLAKVAGSRGRAEIGNSRDR